MAVALLAMLAAYFQARGSVDHVAWTFRDHLVRRNWGAIYDMASQGEKSLQPWNRNQFVSLMEATSQFATIDERTIKVEGDWMGQETRKHFRFQLRDPGVSTTSGTHLTTVVIPFYRDEEGWHPRIFDLALQFNALGESSSRDRARRLYEICQRVGISKLVRIDDRVAFVPSRIPAYLDGDISYNEITVPDAALSSSR